MVINNINIMLRSLLLKQIIKPTQRTLTKFSCRKNSSLTNLQPNYSNKKPPTDKEEMAEKILVSILLIGGGFGSGYIGLKTYKETRNNSFNECVAWTSCMTLCGFVLGGTAVLFVPVVAPIVLVIGIIRYFDYPEPKKYDEKDVYYKYDKEKLYYNPHPRRNT